MSCTCVLQLNKHMVFLCVFVYLFTLLNWENGDDKSAETEVNLRMFLREETGPTWRRPALHHKRACSELWSLSWLSSLARESLEWWSAAILENSECSNSAFFTLTSSFSFAIAPCWPPFTRFHFILLFWNHTFTYRKNIIGKSTQCRLKVSICVYKHWSIQSILYLYCTYCSRGQQIVWMMAPSI